METHEFENKLFLRKKSRVYASRVGICVSSILIII